MTSPAGPNWRKNRKMKEKRVRQQLQDAPPETHEKFKARAAELFKPIDQQIMMCDNVQDLMALAATMLNSSVNMFKNNLGKDATLLLLQDILDEVKKMP